MDPAWMERRHVRGGRWHTLGERVVYFGGSAAIVVLERLAHTDPDLLPNDLQLARFEFSAPIMETKVEELAALPANWTQAENITRQIGGQWRRQGIFLSFSRAFGDSSGRAQFRAQSGASGGHPPAPGSPPPFTFDPRLI